MCREQPECIPPKKHSRRLGVEAFGNQKDGGYPRNVEIYVDYPVDAEDLFEDLRAEFEGEGEEWEGCWWW